MTRSTEERIADVRRLLGAAATLRDDHAALADDLVRATGLTRAGVELAFARHLETDATDADLARLVALAGDAAEVSVILSANVFVGALRAVAVARAASARVVVRPSRREPVFARALVAAAADPAIVLDERRDVADVAEGEIHVYGRAETIAAVRARARPGVRVRAHGPGFGVALVSPRASLRRAARALADDVVAFDQRGCMSPRVALVDGTEIRATAFAEELSAALSEVARTVPRGELSRDERAEVSMYTTTLAFAGRTWNEPDHAVGIGIAGAPLLVPPPGRHVHVAAVRGAEGARRAIAPFSSWIVAFGADDVAIARASAPPHARVSRLGEMQRPPLDGPVDGRVTE